MMTANTRKALDIVYRHWSANANLARDMDVLYNALKRLAAYEESTLSPEQAQAIGKAKNEGRLAYRVCGDLNGGVPNAETHGVG